MEPPRVIAIEDDCFVVNEGNNRLSRPDLGSFAIEDINLAHIPVSSSVMFQNKNSQKPQYTSLTQNS